MTNRAEYKMRERHDALEREKKRDQSDRKENLVNQTHKKHKQCRSDIRI